LSMGHASMLIYSTLHLAGVREVSKYRNHDHVF
jgi:transketolase